MGGSYFHRCVENAEGGRQNRILSEVTGDKDVRSLQYFNPREYQQAISILKERFGNPKKLNKKGFVVDADFYDGGPENPLIITTTKNRTNLIHLLGNRSSDRELIEELKSVSK